MFLSSKYWPKEILCITYTLQIIDSENIWVLIGRKQASLMAQMGKNLPAMQETQVQSLGWEGNGNPLQYSCLENSMDRGAKSKKRKPRGRKPTYAQHKSKLMLGKNGVASPSGRKKSNLPVGQVEFRKKDWHPDESWWQDCYGWHTQTDLYGNRMFQFISNDHRQQSN